MTCRKPASNMVISVLLFLCLGIVGAYVAFMHDLAAARTRLAGRSMMIDTSFGALEYATGGTGEPILIIHGAGGGFDQGIDMAGAMTEHGYQIIVPSRFGYLRSASPHGLTTAMQADAYIQLLDNLAIDNVTVVAISAGAWSALQFAIRHPKRCRALVLLVPADYLPAGTSIRGGVIAGAMFDSDFAAWATLKLLPILPGVMTEAVLGTDAAVVRTAGPDEQARARQIMEHLLPMRDRIEGMRFDIKTAATHEPYPIENVSCPVLAISAEDDRFGTASRARYIAAGVPEGRAVIYRTGGHALIGHLADALHEMMSFLQANPE